MTADLYRHRLKAAGYGWMERDRRWGRHGGGHRNLKDRTSSRAAKRGARNEERHARAQED